ncbi:hypothetical protein AYI69_g8726 [Smittium culicis]|uniref:Uncharacterized protein n=1 Tax=Smittium culicis TaxID=133412 RepID=A0A1R1XHM5_9FUNG|nr:hypothetical protein AYI69_g8726 [Smittium culicis]
MLRNIEAASAKIMSFFHKDEKEYIENLEIGCKIWTGITPIKTVFGNPEGSIYSIVEVPEYFASLENRTI